MAKNVIFGPKMVKIWQSQKNFDQKIFLVGIDSECFEMYFKLKISKSKIFSGTLSFLAQMVKNWQSQKILDGIDSDFFKTYLNLNSRNRKFFPCKMISVILSLLAKIAKNDNVKSFGRFFVRMDLECSKANFIPKM